MGTQQKQPGAILLTPSSFSPPQASRRGRQRMPVPSSASQLPCLVFCFFSISFLLSHCFPETINSGHPCALLPLEASVETLPLLQGTGQG